jgi:hypothetical protein
MPDAVQHDRLRPGLGEARAHQAADQRVARRGWDAGQPGDDVPGDRAGERAEHQPVGDLGDVDDAGADGLGHVQAEEDEGHEVEERGPGDGVAGAQHARGDDGGDRVGRVVQAVQEVERQRDGDQQPEREGGGVHQGAARPGVAEAALRPLHRPPAAGGPPPPFRFATRGRKVEAARP